MTWLSHTPECAIFNERAQLVANGRAMCTCDATIAAAEAYSARRRASLRTFGLAPEQLASR